MDTHARIMRPRERPDSAPCPLFMTAVPAGFPSPADDYIDGKLDLNSHLVKHPAATYFVRADGDSMIGAGIHHGDILVVDRSLKPHDGNVVIAVIDGELAVKRLRISGEKLSLVPENGNYEPLIFGEESSCEIWGVVTTVLHNV